MAGPTKVSFTVRCKKNLAHSSRTLRESPSFAIFQEGNFTVAKNTVADKAATRGLRSIR